MKTKTLFLTLNVFSVTGGIEKVCRIAGKALYEINNEEDGETKIFSLYDRYSDHDKKYFPGNIFRAFNSHKIKFVFQSVKAGINSNTVILSHINLLLPGYLIKIFSPKTKLILLAHGIEIWEPLKPFSKKMLKKCDLILPVSSFTKNKIIEVNKIPSEKLEVLNNCLDPFLSDNSTLENTGFDFAAYNLSKENFILLTVTRISADEQYKGHDRVLKALPEIIKNFPHVRYLIAGKSDASEKIRLENLVKELGVQDFVIFSGYVADEDLPSLYKGSDVYIMPSTHEGFGIVFIEAMYYGKPVIAGNVDGSIDALDNGNLGLLVNPDNKEEIISALKKVIENKEAYRPDISRVMEKFSYPVYKNNFKNLLSALSN